MYYKCHYNDFMDHARCVTKNESNGSCFGYYPLKTKNVRGGIVVADQNSLMATCEGFLDEPNTFFDRQGNYTSKK